MLSFIQKEGKSLEMHLWLKKQTTPQVFHDFKVALDFLFIFLLSLHISRHLTFKLQTYILCQTLLGKEINFWDLNSFD